MLLEKRAWPRARGQKCQTATMRRPARLHRIVNTQLRVLVEGTASRVRLLRGRVDGVEVEGRRAEENERARAEAGVGARERCARRGTRRNAAALSTAAASTHCRDACARGARHARTVWPSAVTARVGHHSARRPRSRALPAPVPHALAAASRVRKKSRVTLSI
eukprot:3241275-Pleurochrysis_carterae.AAC.3